MSKALTLSIVIPVYNEESYINACLEAISRQTVQPDEVLIVDNNSTDETVAIAKRYSFVTVISESRQGVSYAHRTGMSAATGDIIGRIDADTLVSDNWVATAKQSFNNESILAVAGPNGHYDFPFPNAALWLEDKLLKGALRLGYDFLFGCNMAMRRSLWHTFESRLCHADDMFEDMDLVAHMREDGLRPAYNPGMKVMVSARRVADRPADFIRYIHGHVRTARYHNRITVGAWYAEIMFTFFYLLARPVYQAFDPVSRRLSMKRLLTRSAIRPNPLKPRVDEI